MPEVIEPVRAWVDDMLCHSGYLRSWLHAHEKWYQGPLLARLAAMEEESPCTEASKLGAS